MRQHDESIRMLAARSSGREAFWVDFIRHIGARAVAEIGVFRGVFVGQILDGCPDLQQYYLIDPWRHLEDWNKPANKSDDAFQQFMDEAMTRTETHADKRVVLRGTTTEVIGKIDDGSLDLVYIDGDHTLRGIAIDLWKALPKVRDGG